MATLDSFLVHLSSQDTKKKLAVGNDILNYLSIEDNTLECENISAFIDSIIHWLNNSNFKVAQNGLEILAQLTFRMKEDLKPYLSSILTPTTDRLGDSKDCVREQAKALLSRLMNFVSTPQNILEKLTPAFSHKNWRVREELCFFFQECLLRYGVVGSTNGQLLVSKFVPPLISLVSDQNLQVRDTSMNTLVEVYKHVGDRLRQEILRKHANMPQQKLQTLLSKFDDIASTGEVAPSNGSTNGKIGTRSRMNSNASSVSDEIDFKKTPSFKRATSAPPVKRNVPLSAKYAPSSKSSGAADEEMFMNSFEEVPRIQLFSAKDLEQELNRIKEVCSDPNNMWEKRTDSLRRLRSLLLAGAADYDVFYSYLKPLEVPFQVSIRDLRSQVVREACISIAYLSQRIANKLDKFAEALFPTLINLIQNSAKIMSSSAVVAIRFIIQHTHANRLIPIITYNVSSKSKEIRKTCCEFLDQLLHTWSAQTLERHVAIIQEAIKKGISDADPEARAFARKAFWGFADKFKADSDYLLSSLDSGKQKMLQGEHISNWSSTNSLSKGYTNSRPLTSRTNPASTNGSMESLNRHFRPLNGGSVKRSAIPVATSVKPAVSSHTPIRATSAIEIDAQKRARATANTYLNQPKVLLNSAYSSTHQQTPRKPAAGTTSSEDRSNRKTSRVSMSQPGSRSASPSSRLSYYSNIPSNTDTQNRTPRARTLSVTSREQSPSRTPAYERRLSNSSSASRSTRSYMINSDLDLSNKKILNHNDEQMFENALLTNVTPRKKFYYDHSDESETSSICSDVSFANYCDRKVEDISKILENLSSTHWTDRKAAEVAAHFAMSNYDPVRCFQLIKPYINSNESSISIASIKMLTKLVECNKAQVNDLLPEMMPSLLQAYDSVECAVRKATVFCMVAIYGAVGEVMNTYLTELSTCKSKLLKLYIDRSLKDRK